MSPQRIRLRRTKGWRKPEGTMVVSRPSRWGNPFTVAEARERGLASTDQEARQVCVDAFRTWLTGSGAVEDWGPGPDEEHRRRYLASLPELAGHDLACWCPLDGPCHADVLLDLADDGA